MSSGSQRRTAGISDEQWQALADDLRRRIAVHMPAWTDVNDSDPGVTLVELFAFLTENLSYRFDQVGERGALAAGRLAAAARALEAGHRTGQSCGVRRGHYFEGQLLTAADFATEQTYLRARLRRRNRSLHGTGIVTGLEVTIARSTADRADTLHVEPGLAFDARGEEIEVCERQALALPASGKHLSVRLRYVERWLDPVPPAGEGGTGAAGPSRVAEGFVLDLAQQPDDVSIILTRLRFSRGRWRVDKGFVTPRVTR